MNVHLGDLEEYVQQKLESGGYASAAEVIREALREMRRREREETIERRLHHYILEGVDQGPPDGVSEEEWDKRLTSTRDRMHRFVMEGVEQAERGELVDGEESRRRVMERIEARRAGSGTGE